MWTLFCVLAALPPKGADRHVRLPTSLCTNEGTFIMYVHNYNYVHVTGLGKLAVLSH